MKIALATIEDSASPESFSGITLLLRRALEAAGAEILPLGPLPNLPGPRERLLRRMFPAYDRARPVEFSPRRLRQHAALISARLAPLQPDVILARGTWPVARLTTNIPVCIWNDATFRLLTDGYRGYNDITPAAVRHGIAVDTAAFAHARLLVFSSAWAAQSAQAHYGVNSDRIRVLALGANRPSGLSPDQIQQRITQQDFAALRLLFIGTEWERKGGDRFVRLVRELETAGVKVDAHMVGPWPPGSFEVPRSIHCHGRIRQGDTDGDLFLRSLLCSAHFLVLPTRHDCTPVVIPDAYSHALPVVASDVGGLPGMITEDTEGMISPFTTDADFTACARRIASVYADRSRWSAMAQHAHRRFAGEMNWTTHARRLVDALQSLPPAGRCD